MMSAEAGRRELSPRDRDASCFTERALFRHTLCREEGCDKDSFAQIVMTIISIAENRRTGFSAEKS
jgi:hypothetical protein